MLLTEREQSFWNKLHVVCSLNISSFFFTVREQTWRSALYTAMLCFVHVPSQKAKGMAGQQKFLRNKKKKFMKEIDLAG